MLEQVTIKNFALIDSADIEFSEGFTVLSGETGAGKSILIGAISFVLGAKAGAEQIRSGAEEASVTAVFSINGKGFDRDFSDSEELPEPQNARQWLELHGIEDDEGRIILRRFIRSNGRGGIWIGSTPVTRTDLQEFSAFLMDIHGQHEHQSLMKVSEHRKFLDSWAGLNEEVAAFTDLYSRLAYNRKKLSEIESSKYELDQKIEMLTFAVNEISDAKLKAGEDTELEDEESRLSSFEKLYSDIDAVNSGLSGEGGAVSILKKLRNELSHASGLDKSLEGLNSRLDSAFYELSDIGDELRSYSQNLVFDPERLEEVQERLALIFKLKKKYASSQNAPLTEVIAYGEKAARNLEELTSGSMNSGELRKATEELERKVYSAAKAISEKRKAASEKMSGLVVNVLAELGMKNTRFAVNIAEKEGTDATQKCNPYGMDNVEFLINANPGSPLMSLAKFASGGELSRVMLALKTVFAQNDPVDTMIYDEIDTGIGGEIAVAVGTHIKNLSKNKQILCITHLASIAVFADNQIKVEKGLSGDVVKTNVHPVSEAERVKEIARMLSGDSESEQSLEHARAMLAKYSG